MTEPENTIAVPGGEITVASQLQKMMHLMMQLMMKLLRWIAGHDSDSTSTSPPEPRYGRQQYKPVESSLNLADVKIFVESLKHLIARREVHGWPEVRVHPNPESHEGRVLGQLGSLRQCLSSSRETVPRHPGKIPNFIYPFLVCRKIICTHEQDVDGATSLEGSVWFVSLVFH
jgi:hypothetical protein